MATVLPMTASDADRAKAAELAEAAAILWNGTVGGTEERVAAALAEARAEAEVLTRRAETAEAALSIARRGWDTARAEADQLRDAMRALAEENKKRAEMARRRFPDSGMAAAYQGCADRERDLADGGRR